MVFEIFSASFLFRLRDKTNSLPNHKLLEVLSKVFPLKVWPNIVILVSLLLLIFNIQFLGTGR